MLDVKRGKVFQAGESTEYIVTNRCMHSAQNFCVGPAAPFAVSARSGMCHTSSPKIRDGDVLRSDQFYVGL